MKLLLPDKTLGRKLYEQVADSIQTLINEGTLQPGDRLPSVRKLRQQLGVSISTVLEAYRLLEDGGVIAARPQSGYYVKQNPSVFPHEPQPSAPCFKILPLDNSLAFRVHSDIRNQQTLKLGAAVPAPENFPTAALNRLMAKVIRAEPELVHAYNVPPGCAALRREIAKRLMDAGCSLTPEQIVITNGTSEAVYLSLKAVTKPGDTVAIESPCYYGLLEALEALHLKALELPTHPREGISLPHLEAALAEKQIAACIVVSNFSNPLGHTMSDRNKQELVALLNRYDLPLVEDDVYGELYFGKVRPKAIKAFDTQCRVLYCGSVSKTLSSGLRVGWCLPGLYQRRVEQLKLVMNMTTAIAPQLTVAAFFSNGGYERHLRQLRRTYRLQMANMTQAICQYFPAETRVTRPQGGHVLWLELPSDFEVMELYEEALQAKISIAPGVIFSPSGSYSNCLRLNCGLPWSERVEQAMETLGMLIKKQLARKILGKNLPISLHS